MIGQRCATAVVAVIAMMVGLVPAMTMAADAESATSGAFSPAGSLVERRNAHTATLLPDGRVLIVGGGKTSPSAEVWDPATATSSRAGELAKGRKSHTATLLPDGRVLVVGGGKAIAAAETWEPETSTFSPAGRLRQGRGAHTATLLPDGRVLVIGGWKRPGWLTSAEVWDPGTAGFEPTGSLALSRVDHTATLLPDGRVLVIGGHGAERYLRDAAGNQIYPEEPRAMTELWDPGTGSFTPAGTLEVARSQHTATLLPDGRVLVVGGYGGADRDSGLDTSLAEVWDPATGTFERAGWLIAADGQHTASALHDGRVLVVGGTTAEVWEPALASFIPAGSPARERQWHTGTTLQDGRVLIVGGRGKASSSSAEVWESRALPDAQVRDLASEAQVCGELRASFRVDGTTGDPERDEAYLTRCLTCEQMWTQLGFAAITDYRLGFAVYRERCDPSLPPLAFE